MPFVYLQLPVVGTYPSIAFMPSLGTSTNVLAAQANALGCTIQKLLEGIIAIYTRTATRFLCANAREPRQYYQASLLFLSTLAMVAVYME